MLEADRGRNTSSVLRCPEAIVAAGFAAWSLGLDVGTYLLEGRHLGARLGIKLGTP